MLGPSGAGRYSASLRDMTAFPLRLSGKRPPIAGRGGREEGMLAAQLRARGVGDASTLRPGEGAIRLPWEESGGEVRKGEEGCPGTGWHVGAATCGADAGTCQRLSCNDLFCFSLQNVL